MWIAPPSGLRLTSAATTASVRFCTCSRTRAEAALCPPFTARNALVIAIVIFDGSKRNVGFDNFSRKDYVFGKISYKWD